jgi:hypothetical protein
MAQKMRSAIYACMGSLLPVYYDLLLKANARMEAKRIHPNQNLKKMMGDTIQQYWHITMPKWHI